MKSQSVRISRSKAQNGTAIVLIALAMTAMIAFMAIGADYAMMNYYGQRMQNAFDAAALAGASQLKSTSNPQADIANAKSLAVSTCAKHNITITTADVTVFDFDQRIRVEKTIAYPAFFANIFGQDSVDIHRKSTVEKTGIASIPQMTPLALNPADIGVGSHTVSLARNQSSDFGAGNALAISLNGSPSKSVATFQNEFTYGTTNSPAIGESYVSLDAATGQQNAFQDALNSRLSSNNTIIFVPIVNSSQDGNGNIWHTIIGFQAIQITGVGSTGGNGSNKRVNVTYTVLPGYTYNPEATGVTFAANGATTNLYIIRLVDDLG